MMVNVPQLVHHIWIQAGNVSDDGLTVGNSRQEKLGDISGILMAIEAMWLETSVLDSWRKHVFKEVFVFLLEIHQYETTSLSLLKYSPGNLLSPRLAVELRRRPHSQLSNELGWYLKQFNELFSVFVPKLSRVATGKAYR